MRRDVCCSAEADPLSGQLADTCLHLLDVAGRGDVIDMARHADPRSDEEVRAAVLTAVRHLADAVDALRDLAIIDRPHHKKGTGL